MHVCTHAYIHACMYIGAIGADLVTLMVGTSEWDACRKGDVSDAYSALIDAVRQQQSVVPIAVVTPLLSWRESRPCSGPAAITPQTIRRQIERVVQRKQEGGDRALYLIEGACTRAAFTCGIHMLRHAHAHAMVAAGSST